MKNLLKTFFPFFENLAQEDQSEMAYLSYTQEFDAGDVIISPEEKCFNIIVVIEGRLKSCLIDSQRSLLLYYLNEGDICTLAASEDLYGIKSKITLYADTDVRILKTPSAFYNRLKDKYPEMSTSLRRNFMDRFDDILYIMKAKLLSSSKQLVASYIYDCSYNADCDCIEITQLQISRDIAIARSQVSFILSELEAEGIIKMMRGRIKILDPIKLQNI